MSVDKKKVLHMDRNAYYGGESASLNLEQLYKKFRGDEKIPKELGRPMDYCVDLCPKFLMSCGALVKVLLHTRVTRYLEFKSVLGSYVLKGRNIFKVPSSPKEALDSPLMDLLQKRRYKNFLDFVYKYEHSDPKTHVIKGMLYGQDVLDLSKMTARQLYAYFKLEEGTQDFTGHAVALYQSDDIYMDKPALEFVERVKLYANSVARYGNSPYIYPIWGLGGLPEGFSRLCAIHGGTYMLNKPIDSILYHPDGKVRGVVSEGKEAYCKQLIADPSYFVGTDKIQKTGQIARCIAIVSRPIAESNPDSAQIILPAKQIGDGKKRKRDVYVCMVSFHHKVAAEGKYIVVMSAEVEGKEIPALETDAKGCEAGCRRELEDALALVNVDAKSHDQLFFWATNSYAPTADGSKDNLFITATYDASTHFESATREVLRLYHQVTGKALDLSAPPPPESEEGGEEGKEGKEGVRAEPAGDGGAAEVIAALEAGEAGDAAGAPAAGSPAAAAPAVGAPAAGSSS
jgi:Rab GDP dissociation inhibitor